MNRDEGVPDRTGLDSSRDDVEGWPSDFERSLLDSASREGPAPDLPSRTVDAIDYRRRLLALEAKESRSPLAIPIVAASFAAVALAAAIAVHAFAGRPPVELRQEPTTPAGTPSSTISSPRSAMVPPCAAPGRALGTNPLIDDFEDGDDTIESRDGREGFWRWARDTDAKGTAPALLPVPRLDSRPGNKLAMHVKGGKLSDWGASVELSFRPSCYDASVYGGIAFSARGPGRIYVALREVSVIPPEFHGSCEHDCFNAHVRKVDLDDRFRDYEVRWSDAEQRGYGRPPLDPSHLHDIAFQIRPEDTPYDVWLDTVRFIDRKVSPP